MAMMARMRSLAPAFIILVGGLFVLFMVISDSRVLEALGQRSHYVGSINGKDIDYNEFNAYVERARENQKAQTGRDISEEFIDYFRDQVWEAVVNQTLLESQYEKLKIVVSDQEILDVILGPNPPDFLKRNFIDSTGKFNREAYEQALFDPRNKQALLAAEDFVRQQLMQEKLEKTVAFSVFVGEDEILRKYKEQNFKAQAEYVAYDISVIPDTAITYSEKDLKNYYEKNKDRFKVQEQRVLKYVVFSTSPTKEDTNIVFKNLEAIAEKLRENPDNFQSYVEIYSDNPYSKDSLTYSQLPAEVINIFEKAKENEIIGPLMLADGVKIYRFLGKAKGKDIFANASHILIKIEGKEEEARKKAEDIYNKIKKGGNFEEIAKAESQDPGSAEKGGNLGWFGKGVMVPEFEKAVFGAKKGELLKPVKSSYGYHIIKVHDFSSDRFVVETISQFIKATPTTIDRAYQAASDFSYVARKNGFESEAKLMNYTVKETTPFTKDAMYLPELGFSKSLINFAFNNKKGEIGEPFRTQLGYVSPMISETIKEGYKSFEEVKDEIKPLVIREKKFEYALKVLAEVKKQKAFDNPTQINPSLRRAKTPEFGYNSTIPGIGRDFAFIENAMSLPLNEISEPIKGQNSVFLIKAIARTELDEKSYKAQRENLRDQLLSEKRNRVFNQWLENLKKNAVIVDNRYKFYR